MMKDVFLIGSGQTRFAEWWDKSLRDLLQEAMDAAITNAACAPFDIDLVVVANMLGQTSGNQAHLGALAASLLPHRPPALRVESACASGAMAIATACAMLESGRAETVMVVGVEKMTDASTAEIAEGLMGAADAEKDAVCGLTFPGVFGLIAQRYMHEHNLTREDLSLVSVRHHKNAADNPFAQFRNALTTEAVSQSSLVADPLTVLDCSPISDGAAACILSTKIQSPLRLAASKISTDALSLADRATITSFPATKVAMAQALTEADITREDIAHVEFHDCFSIAALLNVEDLGFADPGTGIDFYKRDDTWPSVNRSGGLKACGHPVAATGIKQLIDIGKQLRASGERYGLAHNFGGACGSCALHILEHTR